MKIEKMPTYERPYERLLKYGPEVLTDAELLGIIIKTGNDKYNSVEIARQILAENDYNEKGLRFLNKISIKELMKFNGIGKVKAITLKAVGEIVKRVERPIIKNLEINSTSDVAKILMPELRYEKIEKFCIIFIDSKNKVEKMKFYSDYNENFVNISLKTLFKDIVKQETSRILIAHNHPSGDPTPSKADINFTKELIKMAKVFEIEVLDHIVIGDGVFISIMANI